MVQISIENNMDEHIGIGRVVANQINIELNEIKLGKVIKKR